MLDTGEAEINEKGLDCLRRVGLGLIIGIIGIIIDDDISLDETSAGIRTSISG